MGLFSLGCGRSQGQGAKPLCSAPYRAHFSFSPQRLRVMMQLELVPSPMLEEETSEGAITPRPPQTPWMTLRRV